MSASATTTAKPSVACESCGVTKPSDRLPRGWKRSGGEVLCGNCVSDRYCVRAISLPIREVLDPPLSDGESFFSRFTAAWRLSTDLANWAQRQLLVRDVIRTPDMEQLPRYAAFNLYGLFTSDYSARSHWDGATGSASAILQAVLVGWRYGRANRSRYAVIWRGDSSAAHFRWPYPWIARAAETRLFWQDTPGGRSPCIALSLPGGRQTFRLDCGPDYRRPLRDFAALVEGRAQLGDTKIVGRFRCGKLVGVDVRIAGRFPRAAKTNTNRAAIVRTVANGLLEVEVPDRPMPWRLNMKHLHGLQAAIARRDRSLEALREDTKHEKRWPSKTRARIVAADEPRADRQRRRLKTAIEQAAHQTIMFIARSFCDRVEYDDSCREFAPHFPWHELTRRIEDKCRRLGIAFAARVDDGDE